MNTVFRIIKINILSLLALPFLLLATVSELTARALEKIPLMLRMASVSIVAVIMAGTLRDNTGLDAATEIAVFIAVCAVIVIASFWILSVFSSILNALWHIAATFFNAVYDVAYRIFLSLHDAIETEYRLLNLNGIPLINAVFCFCYKLLHGVDWLIIHLLWLSGVLSILAGVAGAAVICERRSNILMASAGVPLTAILQSGDTAAILYECILLLSIIIPAAVILISLGREWHDWAIELQMDSMAYADYVDSLQDYEVTLYSEDDEPDEDALEMQDILNDHTAALDDLYQEIEDMLSIKNDVLLRNQWNEYLKNLSDIIDEIENKYQNDIPHREFKKLIYRVRDLDRQRKNLFDGIDKILEYAKNPVNTSIYFTGCNTRAQLDKRYRELCKAYHPDSVNGDPDLFIEMKQEYEDLKTIF